MDPNLVRVFTIAPDFCVPVVLVSYYVNCRIEALLLQKRFNQLGGLQLDRDTRALVAGFTDLTQRTVRDKFARLSQMATVLSLEEVREIGEYWGEGKASVTWRLSSADVKQVLMLRKDFRPQDIAAIFGPA